MKRIFVNLKRFDVPESYGGICPMDRPDQWIEWVIEESVKNGLGEIDGLEVIYILPEALLLPANNKLASVAAHNISSLELLLTNRQKTAGIKLACQSVFRDDVKKGGNFGAFSCNLPAAAAANMGCTWTMIAHSEERRDKIQTMCRVTDDKTAVTAAVETMLNEEVVQAVKRGLDVVYCVGETAEEKGQDSSEDQETRVKAVLKAQLEKGLAGMEDFVDERNFVIGYEPIWAIGPGKTPPDKDYIEFVSVYIKKVFRDMYGMDVPVVYGGGLKEANAAMIASIDSINGGLVALTTFTVPPKFEPEALKNIIDAYK